MQNILTFQRNKYNSIKQNQKKNNENGIFLKERWINQYSQAHNKLHTIQNYDKDKQKQNFTINSLKQTE